MLLSLVLILRSKRDAALPATHGEAVHACFLSLISRRDAALSGQLYAIKRDKPFTTSSLQGPYTSSQGALHLREGEHYWLRFTSLDPMLSRILIGIDHAELATISLLDADFEVVRIAKEAYEHEWASQMSFERLYNYWLVECSQPPRQIAMQFFSPTTFRVTTEGESNRPHHVPLPIPRLLFVTLAEKWNLYSPVHLGYDVAAVIDRWMQVARYRLETKMCKFPDYKVVGFVGECTFLLKQKADELLARIANLLADFAFYAGVGYHTTMGLGQVRRLDSRLTNQVKWHKLD